MNKSQLVRAIKAHIERGDKAKDKAEQHYIAAGQHLKELKGQHSGSWAEWEELLKDKIGIGKSRASELMQIADGTKTAAEVTAATTERSKRHRALSPLRNGEKKGEGTGTVVPVDKRTSADGKARRRPGAGAALKKPKNFDEEAGVAPPDEITSNFLDTISRHRDAVDVFLDAISRHRAVLKAYRKVCAVAALDQAQKDEIRAAIRGLVSKWQSLERALAPASDPGAPAGAPPKNSRRAATSPTRCSGSDQVQSAAGEIVGARSDPGPIPECLRRDRVS